MHVSVEVASGISDWNEIRSIEDEVFRLEMGLDLPDLSHDPSGKLLYVIARSTATGEAIGSLCVMETTGDRELHRRYGIVTAEGARVARYTRLAVVREYRGLNLPLRLMLEAQRRFVMPNQIDRTWLCLDANRSFSSLIARLLGFTAGVRSVRSEYGFCRVLQRNEKTIAAEKSTRRAWSYLESFQPTELAPLPESEWREAAASVA